MAKYIIEFIGTFFLVLTIGLSFGNPWAIGGILAVMVYAGGRISGGHYNPAVSLAVLVQRKIKPAQAAIYMVVQLVAAIAAAATYQAIQSGHMAVGPGKGYSFGAALAVEALFTFALVSVVLNTAVSRHNRDNQYYGLAIGIVLMAAVFAGGAISGGAFNPAVGLGPNLYDWNTLSSHVSNLWLYLIGPFVGGLIATLLFSYTERAKI